MSDQASIIFSYFPLLGGEAGQAFMGDESTAFVEGILKKIDVLPNGNSDGCLWYVEDDHAHPVFILDKCDEILEHLRLWAEGEPEKWFSFHILQKKNAYVLALVPDLQKTSERWKIAFQLRYGYPPVPSNKEIILFKPIHFISESGNSPAFQTAKRFLGKTTKVGFIESSEVNRENPKAGFDLDSVRQLGTFPVIWENKSKNPIYEWMDSALRKQ